MKSAQIFAKNNVNYYEALSKAGLKQNLVWAAFTLVF